MIYPLIKNNNLAGFELLDFFRIFPQEWAYFFSVFILILNIIGFLPFLSSILFSWFLFSFNLNCISIQGGDQIAMIFSFFSALISLGDHRWFIINKWTYNQTCFFFNVNGNLLAILLKLQLSYLYFMSFYGKLGTKEWVEGTALYYWSLIPLFRNENEGISLLEFFTSFPLIIFVLNWFVLLLEFVLSLLPLISSNDIRKLLFILGLIFHIAIWLEFGLFTFSMTMIALLCFNALPLNKPLNEFYNFK